MGKLNLGKVAKLSEELARGGSGRAGFDKLNKGKNIRRLLPPKGDNDMFYVDGYEHFVKVGGKSRVVSCLETWGDGKSCPICQYAEKLKNSKAKDDRKLANDLRRVHRIYVSVLNRDEETEEETPKILAIGKTVLKQIVTLITDPDYGDITDFHTGRDLTITKTGEGLQTEYSVIAKPKETDASETMTEEELDAALPDLNAIFVKRTPAELEDILNGKGEGDEPDDDEDEDDEPDEPSTASGGTDYDEMETEELIELCKARGLRVPKSQNRNRIIATLEEDDEEGAVDDEQSDLQDEIRNMIDKRKQQ